MFDKVIIPGTNYNIGPIIEVFYNFLMKLLAHYLPDDLKEILG